MHLCFFVDVCPFHSGVASVAEQRSVDKRIDWFSCVEVTLGKLPIGSAVSSGAAAAHWLCKEEHVFPKFQILPRRLHNEKDLLFTTLTDSLMLRVLQNWPHCWVLVCFRLAQDVQVQVVGSVFLQAFRHPIQMLTVLRVV